LVVSLSASWITALACIEGLARREGVFLRTSKTGAGSHRLRTALRLSRWEILLTAGLYSSAALLARSAHPPLLLIAIIALQGSVYACSPVCSLWNLAAQRVPRHEYRRRFEQRRLRQAGRHRLSLRVPALAAALGLAVAVGAAAAFLAAPDALQPGNPVHHGPGPAPASSIEVSTSTKGHPGTSTIPSPVPQQASPATVSARSRQ
jgi:hypothetical protein